MLYSLFNWNDKNQTVVRLIKIMSNLTLRIIKWKSRGRNLENDYNSEFIK